MNDGEHGYELSYRLAREKLAGIEDLERQCLKSGAGYRETDSGKLITIEYLNRSYRISLPDIEISLADSQEVVPLRDRILMLHYLTHAKGTPLSGKTIAYKELPVGADYFPTFHKRAIKPIVDNFGSQPERLLEISGALGGKRSEYGDIAVAINAFPRMPVTFILWRGDDELPPEGNILFDSTIPDYLHPEDINVLCEIIAWRLVKLLKSGGDSRGKS